MTDPPPLPVLTAARCTGCGDCVAVCPTDCLALAGRLPWLPRPLDCVSCAACELVCPAAAIRLPDTRTHRSGLTVTGRRDHP